MESMIPTQRALRASGRKKGPAFVGLLKTHESDGAIRHRNPLVVKYAPADRSAWGQCQTDVTLLVIGVR